MQSESNYPTLLNEIARFKQQTTTAEYLVAFSGGLDSTVLLHLLAQDLACLPKLHALYIDHQIQVESASWTSHCNEVCQQWSVPFKSVKVTLDPVSRQGVEALARKARYHALYQALTPSQVLLTAHHQRDQVETFLLNLSRGSGVAGLASMPYQKPIVNKSLVPNQHIRPLLKVPYTELVSYALHHQLKWVEDPSNQDVQHRRNQVRIKVIPQLERAFPNIQKQVERTIAHQSEAFDLLNRLAEQDLQFGEYSDYSINLLSYQSLEWGSVKNLLRYWSSHCLSSLKLQLTFEQLAWIKLYGIDTQCSTASLKLRRGSLRLYRNRLYYVDDFIEEYSFAFSEIALKPQAISELNTQQNQNKINEFELILPESLLQMQEGQLTVRNVKTDDKLNRKRLKNWFQERGIPPWQRPFWPVVCFKGNALFLWGVTGEGSSENLFKTEATQSPITQLNTKSVADKWVTFTLSENDIIKFSNPVKG